MKPPLSIYSVARSRPSSLNPTLTEPPRLEILLLSQYRVDRECGRGWKGSKPPGCYRGNGEGMKEAKSKSLKKQKTKPSGKKAKLADFEVIAAKYAYARTGLSTLLSYDEYVELMLDDQPVSGALKKLRDSNQKDFRELSLNFK